MKKVFLILLCCCQPVWAYFPLKMWQAERKAAAGKWAEAAVLYAEALQEQPKNPEATYNLGLCHYRQGQFTKAQELFKQALDSAPPGVLKSQAAYNLGNCQFRQKDEGKAPEDREKHLKEALDSYKTALRWNETDSDARYNIQVVMDLLKKPEQPPKNQPDKDKNQKNKDKQDKDKKDKDKNQQDKDKNQKNKDKDQKDKDKQDQDGKNKPDKQNEKNPGSQSPTPTPTPAPGQQPSPSPQPVDREKEDAERMLKFFQNREKQAQKKRFPARPARPTGEDDW